MSDKFIDVWHGDLLADEKLERVYWFILNDDERSKALTFSRQELKQKYIKTRVILRKVLAHYLNVEPQKINIDVGEYGKPFLVENHLTFNLSHSANKLVIAVSNLDSIGIDMEQCMERKNMLGLVEKCFSDKESAYWYSIPEEQQRNMFFRFWVRKEAFVKAVGRGIALGLNLCVVNPDNQTRFLTIPEGYGYPSNWKIVDVPMNQQTVCAVVVNNQPFEYNQSPFDNFMEG